MNNKTKSSKAQSVASSNKSKTEPKTRKDMFKSDKFIQVIPSKIISPNVTNDGPSAAKVKNGQYGFICSEDEIPILFIDQDTVVFKDGSKSVKSRNGGTALGQDVLDVPSSDAVHVAANTWDEAYNGLYIGKKSRRVINLDRCCVKDNYAIPIPVINGVLAYNVFRRLKLKHQETINIQSWGKNFRDVKFDIISGVGSNFETDGFRYCYKVFHVDVDSNYNATIGSQPAMTIEAVKGCSLDITPQQAKDIARQEIIDSCITYINNNIDYSGNEFDSDFEP